MENVDIFCVIHLIVLPKSIREIVLRGFRSSNLLTFGGCVLHSGLHSLGYDVALHFSKYAPHLKRVLYILDGTIKGEYKAPEDENLPDADRERRLQNWLLDLGW